MRRVDLTTRDKELCLLECELQGATSPRQIAGMQQAFLLAKQFAHDRRPELVSPDELLVLETKLATMIEPDYIGFRAGPAVFFTGSAAAPAYQIPELLRVWATDFVGARRCSPLERYEQYEYAHPREDGNGRDGFCTWAIDVFWKTGQWPAELPPDLFGPDRKPLRDQNYYDGVFGS